MMLIFLVKFKKQNNNVTSDSPRRIDSLGSFFKKESIQKIRSLRIDSLVDADKERVTHLWFSLKSQ